jgi:DNA-binding response OmpR family regulator
MKFLIVEDDPSVVEYIVDILDSMDIEHDAVTNVEDAKNRWPTRAMHVFC